MKTVIIPTFDQFNGYAFVKNVEVKIKNKPDWKDVNKITKHFCGIPQGGIGRTPLSDLIKNGFKSVASFYDTRQRTKMFKGYNVTLK